MSATYAKAMRGESHYRAKLTEEDVRNIRALAAERRALLDRAAALSTPAIAEKYEVKPSCIERVIYGQTWSHVS